jgi:hypothetical protein
MRKKFFSEKKGMILIFSFFLVTGIGADLLRAQEGPKVKFEEETYDFGNIKEGEVKSHVFVFQNTGDAPLLVKNVRTSCGCAAALISDKSVEPGKKGEIKVTFNSRGYEGNVAKYVYVESNDRSQPVKQLQVSATIQVPPRPRIDLDRYTIDSGLILEGEPIPGKATIINSGEQELVVSFSHRDAKYFNNEGKEVSELRIAAGRKEEIEIKIPPRPKAGLIREYILLKSNDTRRPNLSLYVSGYIVTKKQLKELFERYKDKIGME